MSPSKKILFLMSGSIACYKTCDLISKLQQAGHDIQIAATDSALKFIGKASLEGLSGKAIFHDIYEEGKAMDHIHLNRWADLCILSPATANTLNQMASGLSLNVVSSLFLAFDFKKPYIVFPAMNEKMLLHPSTQFSIEKLKTWGIKIVDTSTGNLACGESGMGRLTDTTESLEILKEYL